MFKRDEHRGHVLLQFIPLRIYKFCLFQFSPRLSVSPNVHSTLGSMNREGFSRRSSTVGTGFISTFKAKDLTLCLSTREHIRALTRILKTGVQDSHLAKSRSPTGKSGSPTQKKLESDQFVHTVYLFNFSRK